MTPDEPDSPEPPDALGVASESARSRADLQAELRTTRRKEQKHRHRWRRRILYTLSFIVLIAALGAGGLYVYAVYRFDQIKKVHAKHLVAEAPPGKPFDLLLVGSDTRSFVSNATQVKAFGNDATAGGSRSDVTMVARFDPATKTVTVLSIPRDLWVDIPGNGSIQGMNRINAAFNSGPDLLIQTIEADLGIPINHYVAVDFPGFSGMVDALGGITMNFPTEVKDQYTGLDVTTTGCQTVNGTVALQLVRSRHLYYMDSNGYWEYDGQSDFSRIQRQDAFFRAVLAKLNQSITNPFTINSFIGAAVGNLTIDDTLSQGALFNIAQVFRGLPSSHLITETLPTLGYTTDGGASVLKMAQPYAQNMIDAFNQIGATPAPAITPARAPRGKGVPTTHATPPPHHPRHHHHRAHRAPQPGGRERPERVDGQRHRRHHRDGAVGPGLRRHRDRRCLVTPRRGWVLGDPLRPVRTRGGRDARNGPERSRDPRARHEPERSDGLTADRRLPAHRRRVAAGRPRGGDHHHHHDPDRADDDDHDDDSRGRLRQHPARALEPVPLHARPVDPGVTPDDDNGAEEVGAPGPEGGSTGIQADLRRCRTIRRRSRSVVPPQMPSRSR